MEKKVKRSYFIIGFLVFKMLLFIFKWDVNLIKFKFNKYFKGFIIFSLIIDFVRNDICIIINGVW